MSFQPGNAERVRLKEDIEKILASIAFVIKAANAKGVAPTQYDIVKSLFLADRAHLNKWGRLITFDNYVAMKHGPVPSLAYDFLKEQKGALHKFGIKSLPWKRVAGERGKYHFSEPEIADFEDCLSPSEIDALSSAITTVRSLGFAQIRKLTHEDPAYVEAWDDEAEADAFPMSLALLFESPDYEAARELSEYSPYR